MRVSLPILLACFLSLCAADSPPPRCRVSTSDQADAYECILCDSQDKALREGVTYYVNGDCTFNPLAAPVLLAEPITVTEGVTIRPLDINTATPIAGQLVVTGNGVNLRDLAVQDTVRVRGSEVIDLHITNVSVLHALVALDVAPSDVHHDINITGLYVTGLNSEELSEATETTSTLEPVAMFFHTYGDIVVQCAPTHTVVVQPMIPSGIAQLTDCTVVNFTAILDAYGNAFTYDLYGTPEPQWIATVRSWAITLTLASIGLLLVTRSQAPEPPQQAPPRARSSATKAPTPVPKSRDFNPTKWM